MTRRVAGPLVGVAMLLCVGCHHPAAPPALTAPPPTDPTPVTTDTAIPEPATPEAVPSWDEASRRAVAARARAAVALYARPATPQRRWFSDLRPLLTEEAAQEYRYTDPANVAASKITGKPVITDEATLSGRVTVPTNAGQLDVQLLWVDGAWLVAAITPEDS